MTTKRQQTLATLTRERAVREKRVRKLEKKRAAAAARKAAAEGVVVTDGAFATEGAIEDSALAATDGPTSGGLLDSHEPDRDDRPVPGEGMVPGV